jgi:hypothetical protein
VADIAGGAETGDTFGYSLTVGNFGRNYNDLRFFPKTFIVRSADLAIGVPFEDVGSVSNAGAVNVIYGFAKGLSTTGNQIISQETPGVPGDPESGDMFGLGL